METNMDDFLEKEFFGATSDEASSGPEDSNLEDLFSSTQEIPVAEYTVKISDKKINPITDFPKFAPEEEPFGDLFGNGIIEGDSGLLENEIIETNSIMFENEYPPDSDTKESPGKKRKESNEKENPSFKSEANLNGIDTSTEKKKLKLAQEPETSDSEIYPIDRFSRITILENQIKKRIQPAPNYLSCKNYELIPSVLAMINYESFTVASTRNFRWVFTGGEDGYVYKWDFFASINGKTALTQLQRHQQVESVTKAGVLSSYFFHQEDSASILGDEKLFSPVYSIASQSEGLWILTGKNSGDVGMWSIRHDEGRSIHIFKRHKAPVSALQLTPDEFGYISGSWDKNVYYWDLNTAGVARSFKGHISQLSSLSFQPTNADHSVSVPNQTPILLTTGIDGQSLLWDIRDKPSLPNKLETSAGTPPWALSSCWSANGKFIYVGRRNSKIDEYDVVAGKSSRTLKLPSSSGAISQVCSLPNNNILSGSLDNLRMWDMTKVDSKRTAVPFQIIPGHHGATISQIHVDESGKYLVTTVGSRGWDGSGNNGILFYDIAPK
ncbi:hypothetical protein BB560_000289 [Smittium megazygosporum]|uniref:Transcription factor spt8 beta-propeller domain-containing protein n=1 Tax=Smittium megazygosporum TaxID=133381 RepID=A0A2T9ZKS5_9FUNG|nr:hypothetical protein BB560_000289 [Smittium megazygosporum]